MSKDKSVRIFYLSHSIKVTFVFHLISWLHSIYNDRRSQLYCKRNADISKWLSSYLILCLNYFSNCVEIKICFIFIWRNELHLASYPISGYSARRRRRRSHFNETAVRPRPIRPCPRNPRKHQKNHDKRNLLFPWIHHRHQIRHIGSHQTQTNRHRNGRMSTRLQGHQNSLRLELLLKPHEPHRLAQTERTKGDCHQNAQTAHFDRKGPRLQHPSRRHRDAR